MSRSTRAVSVRVTSSSFSKASITALNEAPAARSAVPS